MALKYSAYDDEIGEKLKSDCEAARIQPIIRLGYEEDNEN